MLSCKNRPSFQEIYIQLAITIAKRSTCSRKQVGCVITSSDFRRVLSIGYNGNAAMLPNSCDSLEVGNCGCLHAEENAIISCSEPTGIPKLVFITAYPCKMCAKRLIQLGGVQKIYYLEDYRNTEASQILKIAKIDIEKIKM
jgi:dCMP deaminase